MGEAWAQVKISTWLQPDCTLGRLKFGDFQCFTLELPWEDNQKNISCIPAGTYTARKHESPSLGSVIHLVNVPSRSWIYLHPGNFTRQIQGCILVGDAIKFVDSDSIPDVSNSRPTFLKLLSLCPDRFQIEITRS